MADGLDLYLVFGLTRPSICLKVTVQAQGDMVGATKVCAARYLEHVSPEVADKWCERPQVCMHRHGTGQGLRPRGATCVEVLEGDARKVLTDAIAASKVTDRRRLQESGQKRGGDGRGAGGSGKGGKRARGGKGDKGFRAGRGK